MKNSKKDNADNKIGHFKSERRLIGQNFKAGKITVDEYYAELENLAIKYNMDKVSWCKFNRSRGVSSHNKYSKNDYSRNIVGTGNGIRRRFYTNKARWCKAKQEKTNVKELLNEI